MDRQAEQKPFRVVVLYSAGHLGSSTILNRVIEMREYEVVGVVRAKTVEFSARGLKKMRKHLKKVGWRFGRMLAYQQLIQGLAYFLSRFRGREKVLRPTWRIAQSHDIPVYQCKNINDQMSRDFIASCKPDLMISAYFSQILKREVIAAPRLGTLNVHPGWLPAYKGAMAYFWVLKNGSARAGTTVHWIDEGIDTGAVVARESFDIKAGMTQQNVLMLTAEIGARLLHQVGEVLAQGKALQPIEISETGEDRYYAMPGSDEFESYFRRRRFFRIRDVFRAILRRRQKKH